MYHGPSDVRRMLHSFAGGWQVSICRKSQTNPTLPIHNCFSLNIRFFFSFSNKNKINPFRLRDQNATCPSCRTEISKNTSSRNLAVEKAVSELPSGCQYCGNEFPNKSIDYHESNECEERPTECKYARIGCQWRGPTHEVPSHETNCTHPKKSGAEVMIALQAHDARAAEEKKLFLTLIDLLSYEKIIFNGSALSAPLVQIDLN